MKCNHCGNQFEGNFCNNCGAPSPQVECKNCGSLYEGRFCNNCGAANPAQQVSSPVTRLAPQPLPQEVPAQIQNPSFNPRPAKKSAKKSWPIILVSMLTVLVGLLIIVKIANNKKTPVDSSSLTAINTVNSTTPPTTLTTDSTKLLTSTATPSSAAQKTYGLGEAWIVDGLWSLQIDSVIRTDYRNPYSDKKPAEVVIITYSYENLGYENKIQDLYILPERVVDDNRVIADTYPAIVTTNPQPAPVGTVCKGAQEAYGLENGSKQITIFFEEYGNSHDKHKATFVVPIE